MRTGREQDELCEKAGVDPAHTVADTGQPTDPQKVVAWLVGCLPNMHKAWVQSLVLHNPGMVAHACLPSSQAQDEDTQVSGVQGHLDYIEIGPAWV
jgi:hypothetical protein